MIGSELLIRIFKKVLLKVYHLAISKYIHLNLLNIPKVWVMRIKTQDKFNHAIESCVGIF